MEDTSYDSSPPKYGRIPRLKGFLPLCEEHPLALHNQGVLNTLIRSRSSASTRRPSSTAPLDLPIDEETGDRAQWRRENEESAYDRRASQLLNGPQMRSMRLIGNSNPRYNWEQYWKTEEELSRMRKPMFVLVLENSASYFSI